MDDHDVIIIGSGPAGLACAGALKMAGITSLVLEKEMSVGSVWRKHYDRLHLHTPKRYSHLPGLAMDKHLPRYPSRGAVVAYLESYAQHHAITPAFGQEVTQIRRQNGGWTVTTQDNSYHARNVIIAAGVASFPKRATWPGLDAFPGTVTHSSEYKNPEPFAGKSVLVVGFGNSGGEIALDLAEIGIETVLSVRSPVNVVPRDVLGIPAQSFSIAQQHLPPKLVDKFNGAVSRIRMGDITKLGLPKSTKGPIVQILEDKRIPLIDIGTLAAIRNGSITVRGAIARFEGDVVHFSEGPARSFDAVVMATGFKPDLLAMLPDHGDILDAQGTPAASGVESGREGLWFCGYKIAPTGHLREIRIEAEQIAAAVAGNAAA